MAMRNSNNYYIDRLNELVPGGAHTYSKGYDQFPTNAPATIVSGSGCKVLGSNNIEYTDFAMSLGSVLLGHAYEPVLEAVRNELLKGSNFCRPSIIEGELAELICDIIPSAEMVKFGKHGSDVVTASIKLARAYTGRKYVARCTSDPFNAVHDWFIGSTVMDAGVPREVKNLTLRFNYNDIESCKDLINKFYDKISCFILEPISFIEPKNNFLHELRQLCTDNGIVLIFDEVVSGFRFDLGGAQVQAGVQPDLSAFGKAMANGFSISALVGKKEIMELAGIEHDKERVFVLSSTHGGETHSFAASIACINEIRNNNLIDYFWKIGGKIKNSLEEAASNSNANVYLKTGGFDVKPAFAICNSDGEPSAIARTFFLQEMINHQILIPYVVPGFSHKEHHVNALKDAAEATFAKMADIGEDKDLVHQINGPLVKPVFRKFNK